MVDININSQRRIIHDPDNVEDTKVPMMPLLVILDNGIIGEAKTIRGAVAIIIGNEYLDAEDEVDEWHMRVAAARREVMKADVRGVYAAVYDKRKGIIENNYAADPQDDDYEIETDEEPVCIHVENERLFILSLIRIGAIRIMEREDSYLLRPHAKWEQELLANGALQCCGRCLHKIEDEQKEILCLVYNMDREFKEGDTCGSYAIELDGYQEEYTGGTYIDLGMEYDIDELMNKVGQQWIIK